MKALKENPQQNLTKKELSRQATMQKLLAAGLEIFSQKGFDGASTKMVAQKAKVNEALIFRYFENKAQFLAAVIINSIAKSENQFVETPVVEDLELDIKNLLTIHHQEDLKNQDFIRVVVARALVDKKMRQMILEHVPPHGSPKLWARLQEHKKAGRIKKSSDDKKMCSQLCLMCVGLMFMAVTMEAMSKKEVEESLSASAKMFTLLHGT